MFEYKFTKGYQKPNTGIVRDLNFKILYPNEYYKYTGWTIKEVAKPCLNYTTSKKTR